MNPITRFAKKYRGRLIRIWFEDFFGWLFRGLPGIVGMTLRWVLYRALFVRLDSFALIYPGVYLMHAYGISAGRSFSINSGAMIDGRGGVTIGDYVMIGPNVVIVSSDHDFRQTKEPMARCDHVLNPVVIGDDVWVGANAVINSGVRIGNGSVIAAGAVVTNDIADYTVVGGVPARVIGNRK